MNTIFKTFPLCCLGLMLTTGEMHAQSYNWISSSEGNTWQQAKVRMQSSPRQTPCLMWK